MKILVTGAAGFIGSRVARQLASEGHDIVALDNVNDYYDVRLKYSRMHSLGIMHPETLAMGDWAVSSQFDNLRFLREDIDHRDALNNLFRDEHFTHVINLAAQAGVRFSISNPYDYLTSNISGFLNILECCRHYPVQHLVFASSSSVYGLNSEVPFRESQKVQQPVSLYAASKMSNELMAHAYSNLYGIPATGLRFFTVYGPWGRPDMAPMLFARAICAGQPIKVFNNGDMLRDFTYIDDIVEGTLRLLPVTPSSDSKVPFAVYNIGFGSPMRLLDFIQLLEQALGKEAEKCFMPMQPGDVYMTYADTTALAQATGYKPCVPLSEGIKHFAEWYLSDSNPLR